MTYTVGSLFSGIGGIDLAFSWAGFDIRWQIEIELFCQAVLRKHAPRYWPNAKVFEDVTKITASELEPVNVMVGGFPCQDVSRAGKRGGIKENTRSGLWIDYARLVGHLRPRVVLLENVPGILTKDGIRVVTDLTRLGYNMEWGIIPASAVGAPHRRDRWFCVAYPGSFGRPESGTVPISACNPQRHLSASQPEWRTIIHEIIAGRETDAVADAGSLGRRQGGDYRQGGYLPGNVGIAAQGDPQRNGWERRVGPFSTIMGNAYGHWQSQPQRDECRVGGWVEHASQTVVNPDGTGSQGKDGEGSAFSEFTGSGRGIVEPGLGITTHGIPGRMVGSGITSPAATAEEKESKAVDDEMAVSAVRQSNGHQVQNLPAMPSRWPARPDQPQYEWEAPRVTTKKEKYRGAKIKALGNSVVPQVVYPLAVAIREYLDQQR